MPDGVDHFDLGLIDGEPGGHDAEDDAALLVQDRRPDAAYLGLSALVAVLPKREATKSIGSVTAAHSSCAASAALRQMPFGAFKGELPTAVVD